MDIFTEPQINATAKALEPNIDLDSEQFRTFMTLGLAGFIGVLMSFLAYLSYSPKIDIKAPAFTKDTVPFIGSWGFFSRKMPFWMAAKAQSKTGNFSFWLGKNHVVGVSGEAARKMYLDSRELDLIKGITLIGHGPNFVPPIHNIFKHNFSNGRSYFQKRLLDLQKTEHLSARLPGTTQDARRAFESLRKGGLMNPATECYRIVITQASRVVFSDAVADSPKALDTLYYYLMILRSTSSLHLMAVPWMPSISYWKRKYGRYGLSSVVTPIVNERMSKGAPRGDDALQALIDMGDSKDNIIEFAISNLFIAGANAGHLTGAMLNIVAHYTEWQEKIYQEMKAVAQQYSKDKNATMLEQLDHIPLEAWETSFPSLDLCYKEAMRIWVAFPMGRFNDTPNAIPIPGTDEVIPPGSYACYNTFDCHYNPELYPNPKKYDPERFSEARMATAKQETYGFMGWGAGRHPCIGMRWAKLQQNIILAYALAMYKWSACDAEGKPSFTYDPKTDVNAVAPQLANGLYCKYEPRNQV